MLGGYKIEIGGYKIERGCVIIARLGRWLNDSASVIDESQLPSASHSAAYHPDHSDSILAIRLK